MENPGPEAPAATKNATPARRSLRSLDWLNFFLADTQSGVGPFLAIYLAGYGWNEQDIGLALTLGGLAGLITQAPLGWLIDNLHAKRALVAIGVIALVAGALFTAFLPDFWPVVGAQVLIGGTSSIFLPAIAAISLGMVGRGALDRRQGRNQTWNAAGNVFAAIVIGLAGFYISNRSIFFFVALFAIPTLLSLWRIRPGDIDHEQARGYRRGKRPKGPARSWELLRNKPLLVLLATAVLFHLANAALLPLLGQLLAKGQGRNSMMFMSACILTTQFTITLIAGPIGRLAGSWGRKPLLLIGFAALPLRALLYTLTDQPALLIAIQILDGVGAG
ncbi:MAG: MFS transporter, partial [Nevskiales bacterium]